MHSLSSGRCLRLLAVARTSPVSEQQEVLFPSNSVLLRLFSQGRGWGRKTEPVPRTMAHAHAQQFPPRLSLFVQSVGSSLFHPRQVLFVHASRVSDGDVLVCEVTQRLSSAHQIERLVRGSPPRIERLVLENAAQQHWNKHPSRGRDHPERSHTVVQARDHPERSHTVVQARDHPERSHTVVQARDHPERSHTVVQARDHPERSHTGGASILPCV